MMVMNGIFSFTMVLPMVQVMYIMVLPMVQIMYDKVLQNRTLTNYIQPTLNGNTL